MTNKHNGPETTQKGLLRVEILLTALLLKLDKPDLPLEIALEKAEGGLEGLKSLGEEENLGPRSPEADQFVANLLSQLRMNRQELGALIEELRERNVLSSQETQDLRLMLRGFMNPGVQKAALKLIHRGSRRVRSTRQIKAS
ncbi:MAG: hypothetical protein N2047_05710 [Meiothermus sp.]|nr:hypothetical protein [Meiothermus sp.]